MRNVLCLILCTVLLCACAPMAAAETASAEPAVRAQEILSQMTLREKIGQLFIVRPDALDSELTLEQINDNYKYGVTECTDAIRAMLAEYPVGGVAIFGKNLASPEQITGFLKDLQAASTITLFTAVDEEGGRIARIANNEHFDVVKYESMEAVGNTGDPENARQACASIAAYLKKYGFNVDFAPDADVNSNPDNIVIGDRSFGSDPELVAQMVSAAVAGFQDAGVIACIKHFPGHGDTAADTHAGFVAVTKTWDQLKAVELIPFRAGLDAGTGMVMVAHITMENISTDGLPASLSAEMIDGRLRGEMGYQGVVIVDAMSMGAIANTYTSGEATVMLVQAGADIALMPYSLPEAFDALVQAVETGKITEERLNESVLRILTLKERFGLLE